MIFHVDLDAFFASIEQRDNPALRGKPVIVGGPSKHRGVVAAASYEARAYGIHSAMPLSQAFRVCPQVIFVVSNFRKYVSESKKFYKILTGYTPYVEAVSVDEAYLSFYGFEAYHKDFTKLGVSIKDAINKTLLITASIGIGTNKVIAKVASSQHKPNGLTYVDRGGEKTFLSSLPIRKLPGIGEQTEKKLKSLGIETIGEVARAGERKLTLLFGKHGVYLAQTSCGLGQKTIDTDWQRKSVGAETTFLTDTNNYETIEHTLYLLTHQAAETLREEGKKARGVAIKLRTSDFATHTHQGKLAISTDSTRVLHEKAKELLFHSWNRQSTLRLIGISFFDLVGLESPLQQSFFEKQQPKITKVDPTLDTIRKKHGFWSIVPAALLQSNRNDKKVSTFQKAILKKLEKVD